MVILVAVLRVLIERIEVRRTRDKGVEAVLSTDSAALVRLVRWRKGSVPASGQQPVLAFGQKARFAR